ncbi:MAG TPA: hypothetical protein VF981_12410 [Gemmatimonadaceae bacterium]
MSVSKLTTLLAAVAVIAIPGVRLAEPAEAQDAPTLVGNWTLNADKTEPVRDRVIEDPEATGAGSTMRTGLGGRRRGGSGGGGSAGGGGQGGRGNFGRMFGGMMQASNTLKITQADSLLLVENEDGPVFVNLRTDGKTVEEPLADQTVLKTKAQWRRTDLIVERSHDVNGAARMTLKLDPKNPRILIVEFHYEHKRQRRTIDQKRIYEAAT